MSQIKNNKFFKVAIKQIPRLLGQLNRNPSSHTYGSFDRAYWHYRTNDINCCRYQEAVYTLTLLYCSDFEGNKYYGDKQVLEWIKASLVFTASQQHSNGSFDEWYINEDSYVGTAFLTASLSQTLLLLRNNNIVITEYNLICEVVKKAAYFLLKKEEKVVMNQVSGAIFAIVATGYLCNKKDLIVGANGFLDKFLLKQSSEGWWSEYGGPDIGYLSLTISYLEKYYQLTKNNKVNTAVIKAKKFVEQFINPDYTAGGEYMARNTEYIIPSLALPYIGAIKPAHLDDRYLCYILYNWIEVGLQTLPQTIKLTYSEDYFSESSLLRIVNSRYFLVANGKKGGSFRLYAEGKVYYDTGLEIDSSYKKFSTGILDKINQVSFQKGSLLISGNAKKIKEPLLKTKIAIVFKLGQLLFGRVSFLQNMIKNFLRSRMISYSEGSTISFKREIKYSSGLVIVTDIIYCSAVKDSIIFGVKASYSAVPSSKYVAIPEIAKNLLSPDFEEEKNNGMYILKRIFSFNV